jgi:integrase
MPWPTPLADAHPDDLALIDDLLIELPCGDDHRRNTRYTVHAFARWLAARGTRLPDATKTDCAEWFAARRDLVVPNTQVSNWVQLKGWFKVAAADTVTDPLGGRRSPMAGIPQPWAPKYVRTKAARLDEFDAVMGTFDKRTMLGLRNATMISLMFRSGVRVGELAQLDLVDVDLEERRVLIEETKNDEPRRPPIHPDTLTLLRRYLRRRGDRPGPLFVNEGARRRSDRLKTASIQTMFKRAVKKSGVKLTPHTLRRGWYAEYMEHGGDVVTAMHIAGWRREVMPYNYGADRRDATSQVVFDEVAQRQVQAGRRRLRAV